MSEVPMYVRVLHAKRIHVWTTQSPSRVGNSLEPFIVTGLSKVFKGFLRPSKTV